LLSVISFLVSWLKQAGLIVSILFPSRFGLSGMQSFSLLFHFLFPYLLSKPLFFFIAKLRLMVHHYPAVNRIAFLQIILIVVMDSYTIDFIIAIALSSN